MNLSELARKLNTTINELKEKLPGLGFDVGLHAIKVDDHSAQQIIEKWSELKRKERVQEKFAKQLGQVEEKEEKTDAEKAEAKKLQIPAVIAVRDFATRMNLPVTGVIRELMKSGILATLNDRIDYETASIVAEDLGFLPEQEVDDGTSKENDEMLDRLKSAIESDNDGKNKPRPPIVVVMGHVDHGKTTLLDAIRTTNVVAGESGGITQHIGAYQVVKNDHRITFIDTPGHEAFTVMRSRGAKVADMAILVVAADDGVKPQTKEAINIIKAAGIPFIVALNKMDKPDANVEKAKSALSEVGLIPEDWGGKTVIVPVSAKTGAGIDQLIEMLILTAEMEKDRLIANPDRNAIGTIIESHIDKGAGPIATVLVQTGTMWPGDILGIKGVHVGRVRTMRNWKGEVVLKARPATPVQVLGFKSTPAVGDVVEVADDTKGLDTKKVRQGKNDAVSRVTATNSAPTEEEGGKPYLNIVIRTDVLGSIEALMGMFEKLKNPDVILKIVRKGLGSVTDSDILSAESASGLVYAFRVPVTNQAEQLSREKHVEIKRYDVIYDLFNDVKANLEALLPKEIVVTELGKLEVLAVFKVDSGVTIAGGRVVDGKLQPNTKIRIARGGEYVGEGAISELQLGKQTVKQVGSGQECGIKVQSKTKLEVGDRLETYKEEERIKKSTIGN